MSLKKSLTKRPHDRWKNRRAKLSPETLRILENSKIIKTMFTYSEYQELICKLIGYGYINQEIVNELSLRFGIKLHTAIIQDYRYDRKFLGLIKKYRDEYVSTVDDVPGFHKKIRLARMEIAMNIAFRQNYPEGMIRATEQQRKEVEGNGDTSLTIVSNRYYQMTDEEILQREEELLLEMKNQKGGAYGLRRVEVEVGKPGESNGVKDVQ